MICHINRAGSQCQWDFIFMVALSILSYARNQKSNVHQIIKSHFTLVFNIAKRYIYVLHSIDLYVSYNTICIASKK